MEIVEITGTSYPSAKELRNKSGRPISKHQKSPGGNSWAGKHRTGYVPRLGGKALTEQQNADRDATAKGKLYLVIVAARKRKWVREVDYLAGNW